MNLFLVGWSPSGDASGTEVRDALTELLARIPFFGPDRIECWEAPSGTAALAWVGHEEGQVGGVRYIDRDDEGIALFSGRPFRWTGDGKADGRGPLDPGFYRRPAGTWLAALDGRFCALRYDERKRELDVYADPLGTYPLFSGTADGTRWISNSAELVRTALGSEELDLSVAASLLGAGHGISGDPIWAAVRRMPRGAVIRLRSDRADWRFELLPVERISSRAGRGLDPDRAASALVAATGALADWPERPVLLQLSGGLDSRLVLAAALAARVDFEAISTGSPESPDVEVAGLLCAQTGIRHRVLPRDPGHTLSRRTREVASVVALAAGGTISCEYAAGYPIDPSSGRLPLWLGGQGGEIARAYYGTTAGRRRDGVVDRLFEGAADTAELLSDAGRKRLRRAVAAAVDRQLEGGAPLADLPDLFYLFNRMGTWSASGFGCVEYAKGDSIAPLWTQGLLDHQLGSQPAERERERFHEAVLERLSPRLAAAPFAKRWHSGADEMRPAYELARQSARNRASHPAWEVIDRDHVDAFLAAEPDLLGERERRKAWRLATVLACGPQEDG